MEQPSSFSDVGKLVLIMKVQISDDLQVKLLVHEYDEPEILAMRFCRKHSLNQGAEVKLAKEIESQIDILLDEMEEQDTRPSTLVATGADTNIQTKSHDKILDEASNRLKNSPGDRFTSLLPEILEYEVNKHHLKRNNESPIPYETTQYNRRVNSYNPSPNYSPIRTQSPNKSPTKMCYTPQESIRPDSPGRKKSLQICEKLQEERIKHIFKEIGGYNGVLKKGFLTLISLPPNLVEILKPIVEILDFVKYDIFFTTFQKLFLQLLKTISPHEKDELLLPKHRWVRNHCISQPRDFKYSMSLLGHKGLIHPISSNEFTFHPKINSSRSSNMRSKPSKIRPSSTMSNYVKSERINQRYV